MSLQCAPVSEVSERICAQRHFIFSRPLYPICLRQLCMFLEWNVNRDISYCVVYLCITHIYKCVYVCLCLVWNVNTDISCPPSSLAACWRLPQCSAPCMSALHSAPQNASWLIDQMAKFLFSTILYNALPNAPRPKLPKCLVCKTCAGLASECSSLLAPQSGAHRITPHRDFHPNPYQPITSVHL